MGSAPGKAPTTVTGLRPDGTHPNDDAEQKYTNKGTKEGCQAPAAHRLHARRDVLRFRLPHRYGVMCGDKWMRRSDMTRTEGIARLCESDLSSSARGGRGGSVPTLSKMSSPPALVHDICILGLLQLLHPAEEEGGLRYGRQSTWNAHHELLEAARLSGRGDSLSTELLERLSFASRPGRCPYLGDLSQFIDVLFHGWSDEMREALELFLAAWLDELDSPAALAALVDRHKVRYRGLN